MTAGVAPVAGSRARLGFAVAGLGLVLDQATKHWVLDVADLGRTGPLAIAPFADLRLVWNAGISYGLLQQNSDYGRWLLVGLSLAAAVGLAWWLTRATGIIVALSVALILSGAIGNAIDRAIYGAVIDFVYIYTVDRAHSWYVFNLADAWIVAGVVGLLYDSIFVGRRVSS
ncbi:MAG: signal peptidase II [Ancalomicrobiaceae bacterium]|nr:signal peptidase II [Ancalomicrobiaceae bacterium]